MWQGGHHRRTRNKVFCILTLANVRCYAHLRGGLYGVVDDVIPREFLPTHKWRALDMCSGLRIAQNIINS